MAEVHFVHWTVFATADQDDPRPVVFSGIQFGHALRQVMADIFNDWDV
eukprot:CAMPEP_0119265012 /NCGR_PEP_ID=MMETSP1329-20130426/3926_1 /TAXON_ID=114041 /ORGANISM="Genus nov. species nov., Strain RCC1024" /LENGTH=47 /DNA_ID= /DNA_START= /DNA_END= /DNA_ORIENTATION=